MVRAQARIGLLNDPDGKACAFASEFVREMMLDAFSKPGVGLPADDDRVTCVCLGRFQKVFDDIFPVDRDDEVGFHGSGGNSCVVEDRLRFGEDGLRQFLKIADPHLTDFRLPLLLQLNMLTPSELQQLGENGSDMQEVHAKVPIPTND